MNGRRYNVHEPELDYGVESDEDWEEPADGELLTVCPTLPAHHSAHVMTCLVHSFASSGDFFPLLYIFTSILTVDCAAK